MTCCPKTDDGCCPPRVVSSLVAEVSSLADEVRVGSEHASVAMD